MSGTNFFSPALNGTASYVYTKCYLGSFPCTTSSSSTTGQNSTIVAQIPSAYTSITNDTTLDLTVVRKYDDSSLVSSAPSSIIISNPNVIISYPPGPYCKSDTNPTPTISGINSGIGLFFTQTGIPLQISPTDGTINLQEFAAGTHNVHFSTRHPACPDTTTYPITIIAPQSSYASYGGDTILERCQSGTILSDSLYPLGGNFQSGNSNLIFTNSLTGEINLAITPADTYTFAYLPNIGCFDTAEIKLTVIENDSVILTYPGIGNGTVCKGNPNLVPLMSGGVAWGTFIVTPTPNGLSIGPNGVIDPSASDAGTTYNILYRTVGDCSIDQFITQVAFEEVPNAWFSLVNQFICENDTLKIDSAANPPGNYEILQNNSPLPFPPFQGNLAPGNYELRHITSGFTLGLCTDTFTLPFTILRMDSSHFEYLGDNYCQSSGLVNPAIYGLGGGIFSCSSLGNALDSTNGQIDLIQSSPGTHYINYQTNGPCPSNSQDNITILNAPDPSFSYPASQYCTTDSSILPDSVVSSGGIFSTNTPGLSLVDSTGQIDFSQSLKGTYQVFHTLLQCNATSSWTIELQQTDTTIAILFPFDSICRDFAALLPSLSFDPNLGQPVGVWSLAREGQPVPYTGGSIDPTIYSDGLFQLEFQLQGCGENPTDEFRLLSAPSISLTYGNEEFCDNVESVPANLVVSPASKGIFYSSDSGLILSNSSGTIDISNSSEGNYTVTYKTLGFCNDSIIVPISVHHTPRLFTLETGPDTIICAGDSITANIFSLDLNQYGFLLNGTPLNYSGLSSVPFIPNDGDLLTGWTSSIEGCFDTLSKQLIVAPKPFIEMVDSGLFTVGEQGLQIPFFNGVPSTLLEWQLSVSETVLDSGIATDLGPGDLYAVSIPPSSQEGYSPFPASLKVETTARNCIGDPLIVPLTILPRPGSIYIPEAFSPNEDGFNDCWEIRWSEEIDPSEFEVQVFNRSQGLVSAISPLTSSWKGTFLPDGVYSWVLFDKTQSPIQQGGLTIRRK